MKRIILVYVLFPLVSYSQSQQPAASEIKLNLKKLNFLGSALYVAAHPDDENTRVIAYMMGERLATTAYLSMTRGDGGQNLIGPEMRDLLGLIRTQELITARQIDGGQQFFTRANDFGYSKSADETFRIWNKDEILSDVVRRYRSFQPDIIFTRFPPDERAGHGHHTASSVLAHEAFDISSSPSAYPEQLKTLSVWQPKRIYINTGRFFSNNLDENTPGITTLNVGGYNALLGQSYSEIAATSRSQHKSQGFGAASRRGDALDFFELTKGAPGADIFDGINTTWSRVKGGEKVQPLVEKAIREFDMEKPFLSVPILLQIRKMILNVEPGVWRTRKLEETQQLIQDCMGLFIEIIANTYWASPEQTISLNFEIINRSMTEAKVQRVSSSDISLDSLFIGPLKNNIPVAFKVSRSIRADKLYSDPYWLKERHSVGLFTVTDPALIGMPENTPAILIDIEILVGGELLTFTTPVKYKWTDPVKGELFRPFEIVPPVFLNLPDPVMIFKDGSPRQVKVLVKSNADNLLAGELALQLPVGWKSEPASFRMTLTKRGEEQTQIFSVVPSNEEQMATLKATFKVGFKVYDHALLTIQYDHIPIQTLLPKAEARIVRINLKKEGKIVGYIKGAGDDIPVALANMGYEVVELNNGDVTLENLERLDAIVLGVRAFNTNERLRFMMSDLLTYVKKGGTLVVQYNTNFDLGNVYSPYPLKISRDRVAEEDSQVRILKPDHPVLNFPNKITLADFDGWVQERGLYFPNSWDEHFETLLSMNDTGESPKDGSLLIAKHGNGYYVYTGLSFFRELPEGVPGAYRLFANIVSLGKGKEDVQGKTPKTKGKSK